MSIEKLGVWVYGGLAILLLTLSLLLPKETYEEKIERRARDVAQSVLDRGQSTQEILDTRLRMREILAETKSANQVNKAR